MDKLLKLIILQIIIFTEIIGIPCLADNLKTPPQNDMVNSLPDKMRTDNRYGKDISINQFKITPKQLVAGQEATLIWQVSGAARVYIDNDKELDHAEVSPAGKITITPLNTTIYTLTAHDDRMLGAGAVATIDVNGQPPRPSISFSAEPDSIVEGDKAVITWETHYADTVSIDNGVGIVGLFGTIEITPLTTTTYILSATGLGGSSIASITITVANSHSAKVNNDEP